MASSSPKIHHFKKSAIEAGKPDDYYLNPSDNLWKIASMWSVVENEDDIVLSINMGRIGKKVYMIADENIVTIIVDVENKEKAGRFDHKDGMKKFFIEINPKFLKIDYQSKASFSTSKDHGGTTNLFITKLKESSAGRMSDLDW